MAHFVEMSSKIAPLSMRRVSISERSLQTRLNAYLENPALVAELAPHDRHGLLKTVAPAAPASLDELLEMGDELLDDPNESLFVFKHAKPPAARPDKVSERVD